MEQNFQTSFIPKKPIIEQRVTTKRPISILVVISVFIFLTMVIASGGLYFYKNVLTQNIKTMQGDLTKAKGRFEPEKITLLQTLDKRLAMSNKILSKHIAISPIFKLLQSITMKTVRYNSFSYSFVDGKDTSVGNIKVSMTGQAVGYRSVALQADLFSKNKNLIDPVFSGLSLDDKGNVLFNLVFSVDPSFVDYKQLQKTEVDNSSNVGSITSIIPTINTSTPN